MGSYASAATTGTATKTNAPTTPSNTRSGGRQGSAEPLGASSPRRDWPGLAVDWLEGSYESRPGDDHHLLVFAGGLDADTGVHTVKAALFRNPDLDWDETGHVEDFISQIPNPRTAEWSVVLGEAQIKLLRQYPELYTRKSTQAALARDETVQTRWDDAWRSHIAEYTQGVINSLATKDSREGTGKPTSVRVATLGPSAWPFFLEKRDAVKQTDKGPPENIDWFTKQVSRDATQYDKLVATIDARNAATARYLTERAQVDLPSGKPVLLIHSFLPENSSQENEKSTKIETVYSWCENTKPGPSSSSLQAELLRTICWNPTWQRQYEPTGSIVREEGSASDGSTPDADGATSDKYQEQLTEHSKHVVRCLKAFVKDQLPGRDSRLDPSIRRVGPWLIEDSMDPAMILDLRGRERKLKERRKKNRQASAQSIETGGSGSGSGRAGSSSGKQTTTTL